MTLGTAYTLALQAGHTLISYSPRRVILRTKAGHVVEWSPLGFERLVESLTKERYQP